MGCTDGRGLFAGLVRRRGEGSVIFHAVRLLCGRCCWLLLLQPARKPIPTRPITMVVPFAAAARLM